MTNTATILALRERIPATSRCLDGCHDCCGPVPVTMTELARIEQKRASTIERGSIDCAYAEGGQCAIHSERPIMCRLFAAVDTPMLECPHGVKSDTPLSQDESDSILREYHALGEIQIL